MRMFFCHAHNMVIDSGDSKRRANVSNRLVMNGRVCRATLAILSEGIYSNRHKRIDAKEKVRAT